MPEPHAAAPERLAAELAGMLRTGVTLFALRDCQGVLDLSLVRSQAPTEERDDLAAAAQGVVHSAAIRVDDGDRYGPHATLLALAPGTRGALLKVRRRLIADMLVISPETVRTERQEPMLEAVANEIRAADSAYRFRQSHRTKPTRAATDSGLGIDWLDRHRSYRRVWMPIAALRDDLWVLLRFLRRDAPHHELMDRVMTMSWRYAQFSRQLERFCEEDGGRWLLADVDADIDAGSLIQQICFHLPFGSADESWLRLQLDQARSRELDSFIDLVYPTERGKEVVTVWLDWARTCGCDLDEPEAKTCEVHTWIGSADQFIRLIDADWYRIADFYRTTEKDIHGTDISQLWRVLHSHREQSPHWRDRPA